MVSAAVLSCSENRVIYFEDCFIIFLLPGVLCESKHLVRRKLFGISKLWKSVVLFVLKNFLLDTLVWSYEVLHCIF